MSFVDIENKNRIHLRFIIEEKKIKITEATENLMKHVFLNILFEENYDIRIRFQTQEHVEISENLQKYIDNIKIKEEIPILENTEYFSSDIDFRQHEEFLYEKDNLIIYLSKINNSKYEISIEKEILIEDYTKVIQEFISFSKKIKNL
jgi:hypothetical protein